MPGAPDLSKYFRHFTPVRKGEAVESAANHMRINAIQDAIKALARGENIASGVNLKKKGFGSSVMLSAPLKSGTNQPALTDTLEQPFEVVPITDSDGVIRQIGVVNNSHLLNGQDRNIYEEDNAVWGLLSQDLSTGGIDISGLNYGDKIYLEIQFNEDGTVATILLKHGPVGTSDWGNYPDPVFINTVGDPYQQYYYQIIAEISNPDLDPRGGILIQKGSDFLQVTQLLSSNLILVTAHTADYADEPNVPILVTIPWNGPGTDLSGGGNPVPQDTDIMTPWELGESTTPDDQPFQVLVKTYDNDFQQIGITFNSHVFNSEDGDVYEEENTDWGLLSADKSSGWFNVGNIGDKIWLQIAVNQDQSIESIDIKAGKVGAGTDWPNYPDPISLNVLDPNNPFQTQYNQIIAEVTDFNSDSRGGLLVNGVQVVQLLSTNLMMTTAHTTLDAPHPNVPLIVPLAWNAPGTSVSGDGSELPPSTNLTTPWALGSTAQANEYSFMLSDATDSTGAKVRVSDGEINGQLPSGMGSNQFILALPNNDLIDPGTDGENDIYLQITYDFYGNVTSLSINAVAPANLPESDFGSKIVLLGYVLVHHESLGGPILSDIHNTWLGDIVFDPFPQRYSFQMFDASDSVSAKVLISDGKINGVDGSDHVPQGMGNNDYILVVQNEWDVWMDIPYDPSTFQIIDPVTLASGPEIPNDIVTGAVHHSYIQIGSVTVQTGDGDIVPEVVPTNMLCGDYSFADQSPSREASNIYSFKMVDASVGGTAKVRILDGNVIDVDGGEHTPSGMGNDDFVVPVNDDDAIYMIVKYNRQTGAIIDPVTIGIGDAPSDTPGTRVVEIGYVNVVITGSVAQVIPHNTLCGDYQFEVDDGEIGFGFQMLDATDTSGVSPVYKVRILDGSVIDSQGNEHLPTGMGNDSLTITVQNDWTVFLTIPHDRDWNITGPVTISAASAPPTDTTTASYIDIGYVNVDPESDLIVRNSLCGDFDFEPPPEQSGGSYAFQMLNASDINGPKVLILDGQVFGVNDDGILPTGMGGDNFILSVFNNDEVFLIITIDPDTGSTTSVTINRGTGTPGDTTSTKYVTIGYIALDSSGIVHPTNALCGDYTIPYALSVTGPDQNGNDNSLDEINQINFLGAATVQHDPGDINPNAVDIAIGPDVSDGVVQIDNPSLITFTRESTVQGRVVEDGGGGEVIVHVPIGVDVAGTNTTLDNVELITFDAATVEDNGGGEVIVHIIGRIDLSDSSQTLDNVELIHFQGASISDNGGGEAVVTIPSQVSVSGSLGTIVSNSTLINISPAEVSASSAGTEALVQIIGMVDIADSMGGSLDNCELLTFVGATVDNGGGGEAIITITPGSGINVSGDGATGLNNAGLLNFQGATISNGGNGEAIIQITSMGSGFNVTGDTGSVNQPTILHFIGATVTNPSTGEADISITGTVDVIGDSSTFDPTTIDNSQAITFHGAPVQVSDNGGGEALVTITGMMDVEADNGTVDNVELLQFPGAEVTNLGSTGDGYGVIASIEYPTGITLQTETGGQFENIDFIFFKDAAVSGLGGTAAQVTIFSTPPSGTSFWINTPSGRVWGAGVPASGPNGIMISENGNAGFIQGPSSGTYVLGIVNGSISFIPTTTC